MAFRFRLDDDAAAFDADDADRDVAVDERPIGHGIDAFLADADRSRRAQNGNRRPPFVEVTAIVFLRRIALFLSRTVLKGQFIKERALGQVASQEVEYNDGQDGPAGQDVDRLIRRSEHKEQAAKQEDDTGQAKDTDARRSQFKADTQQADQKRRR